MKNSFTLICVSFFVMMYFSAPGQTTGTLQGITAKLKTHLKQHPTEKAYLHFDKPYYAAGDTIYFKAYVTLGDKHELSSLSGVLHVDLINTGNKIERSIKLQIKDGVAWGDFALPDSLPKGGYRIRAYTQWMRNDGEAAFFEKAIPIGSALNNKIPESGIYAKNPNGKPDLQFFPEGGQLVTSITSVVAFKAIDANGLGIALKGMIIDNTGETITKFSTTHLGMGSFKLKPETGKSYMAKVTYADGLQAAVNLPAAQTDGIVLKIDNARPDHAAIQLLANEQFFSENRDKNIGLLVYTSGFVNAVSIKLDSATVNLGILKRHLHTGITKVTLFSPNGEPLSERQLFVQNPDQLKLTVSTAKTSYSKREKVRVNINALTRADSATMGHFSISVIDETKLPVDEDSEQTILTSLLLTSDLKGYIQQPNYYFRNISGQTQGDLDLVMLTHGYRRFEWKKLVNNEYPTVAFQPEKGLQISGVAKSLLGKPLVNGTVSLLSQRQGLLLSRQTDDKGNFHFSNLIFTDSTKFILQAVTAKGKNSTKLIYKDNADTSPVVESSVEPTQTTNQASIAYLANILDRHNEAVRYGQANGIMLKEVKVREKKRDDNYPSSNLGGPGHADQVVHRAEIANMGGMLADRLNGKLKGVVFYNGVPVAIGQGGMLIMVDGIIIHDVNIINPTDVETVEVLKTNNATIYGFNTTNGALIITTRKGSGLEAKDIASIGILPVTVYGFCKAREFYAPKYDHPDDKLNRPDLRTTIYWKPELQTDKEGNGSLEYYNADGAGTYRIVIEGIDEKGNLGRQVYRYKVE